MTPRCAKFIVVWLIWSLMAIVIPSPQVAQAQLAGRAVQPNEFFQTIRAEAQQKCDPQSGRGIGSPLNRETNPFARDLHQSLSQSLNDAMTQLFEDKLPRLLESNINRIVRQELNSRMSDFSNLISRRIRSLRSQGYSDLAPSDNNYDARYDIRNQLPTIIAESYQEFLTNFSQNDLRRILEAEIDERAPELIGEYFQAEYERDELGNLIYRNENGEVVADGNGKPTVIRESELQRIIENKFGPEIDTLVQQFAAQQVLRLINQIEGLLSEFITLIAKTKSVEAVIEAGKIVIGELRSLGEQISSLQSAMSGQMQRKLINAMTHYALEAVINSDALATYSRQGGEHWLDNGFETMAVDTESEANAFSQSSTAEAWVNNFRFDSDLAPLTTNAPEAMFNALLGPENNPFIERNRVARGGLTDAQLSNIFTTGFSGQLTAGNRNVVGNLSPRGYQNLVSQGFGFDTVIDSSIVALANTGSDIAAAAVTSVTDAITAPLLGDFRPPTSVDGLVTDIGGSINANTNNIANAAVNGINNLGNTFKGALTDSLAGGLSQLVAGVPYAGPLLASLTNQLVTDLVTPILNFLIPTSGVGAIGAAGGATVTASGASEAHAGAVQTETAITPYLVSGEALSGIGWAVAGVSTAVTGATAAIVGGTAAIEASVNMGNTHLTTVEGQTKTSNENEGTIIQTEEEIKALNLQQCMYDYFVERTQGYLAANQLFYDRQARQKSALAIQNHLLNLQKGQATAHAVTSGQTGVATQPEQTGNDGLPLIGNLSEDLTLAREETTGVFLAALEASGSPWKDGVKEKILTEKDQTFIHRIIPTIDQGTYETFTKLGGFIKGGGWASWLLLIQPRNNPVGAEYLAREELARRQTLAEQNTRENLLASAGWRDIRECEEGAIVEVDGKEYCAKWKVLTPGSTFKAYWDRLLASVLEQAGNVQTVGQDFINNFFPLIEQLLADPTVPIEDIESANPSATDEDNLCPGPGPCLDTGWQLRPGLNTFDNMIQQR